MGESYVRKMQGGDDAPAVARRLAMEFAGLDAP
jgi:hypothetical protein